MTVYNPVIDMSSIRVNSDGDLEFDITATKTEDKSSPRYEGYLTMSFEGNIENLIRWYCHNCDVDKTTARNFLNEFRELGREAWLEKYSTDQNKSKEDLHPFSFDAIKQNKSETIWELRIFDNK